MTELVDAYKRRVTINTAYVVSIHEIASWVELDGVEHVSHVTQVKTADGATHIFKGTYEEVLKELA